MCMAVKNRPIWMKISAFSKARLLPELWRVLSCESLAVFLHFPLEEKEPWGPFYQLWQVLAKLTESTDENSALTQ